MSCDSLLVCYFSLRVEGTIPGFEVKVSDKKLATLVKVQHIDKNLCIRTTLSCIACCVSVSLLLDCSLGWKQS